MVDVANLCMGCMEMKGAEAACPHCGYKERAEPDSLLHLRARTELHGQYLIGRVLGHGGFGVTYLGWDLNLERKIAIKEYMPSGVAVRTGLNSEVIPFSGDMRKDFEYGLERYLDEARTVARFQTHPSVVSVLNFFRANGTAYLVMEYLEGATFERYLEKNGGKTTFDTVLTVMVPVLDALGAVHQTGILHRDISPDNIYITRKWQVKVLDFGAARYALGQKSRNLSVILKEGYAPVEQYHSKGNQGPWTDVYACASTIYRALTGEIAPASLERMNVDLMPSLRTMGVEITPEQEQSVLKGMAVQPEARFRTMREFRDALTGVTTAEPVLQTSEKLLAAMMSGTQMVPQAPVSGTPVSGTPVSQAPISHTPVSQTPISQRPVSGRPISQRPVSGGGAAVQSGSQAAVPLPTSQRPITRTPQRTKLPGWIWAAAAGMLLSIGGITGYKVYEERQREAREAEVQKQRDLQRVRMETEIQKQKDQAAQIEQQNQERKKAEEIQRQQQEEQDRLKRELEEKDRQLQQAQKQNRQQASGNITKREPVIPPQTPPQANHNPPQQQQNPLPVIQPPQPGYDDLMRQASNLSRSNNTQAAMQYNQQAIRLNPARPEAYSNIGWIALYGSGDIQNATTNYREAINRGGIVWFRVRHDHSNLTFQVYCTGNLGIAKDHIEFVAENKADNFRIPRSALKEIQSNKFNPFRPLSGDFHVRDTDGRNFNLISVTTPKAVRDMILQLANLK